LIFVAAKKSKLDMSTRLKMRHAPSARAQASAEQNRETANAKKKKAKKVPLKKVVSTAKPAKKKVIHVVLILLMLEFFCHIVCMMHTHVFLSDGQEHSCLNEHCQRFHLRASRFAVPKAESTILHQYPCESASASREKVSATPELGTGSFALGCSRFVFLLIEFFFNLFLNFFLNLDLGSRSCDRF
jgi:hypothetical protein